MTEPVLEAPAISCPRCGGAVIYDFTCHTYEQDGRWSACLPCDSAIEYFCATEGCDWSYDHGLNPKNPRAAYNEQHRPAWLDDSKLYGQYGATAHPGATATWDR